MSGIYAETETHEELDEVEGRAELRRRAGKEISDLEYVLQQRALFTSNIHLADQKSGYIAILHGVLISGISSILQNNTILAKFSSDTDRVFYVLAMVMLFASFVANMLAFTPRARRSVSKDSSWIDIANSDVDGLVRFINTETNVSRITRITSQVKTLAQICDHKFTYIKYSLLFLALSMSSSLILYLRLVMT